MSVDDTQEETLMYNEPNPNDSQISIPITEPDTAEPQPNGLSTDPTINPVDEDSQFIYDEDTGRLICIGSSFEDIPLSIIEKYSQTTKILDLSKNRFRSLACIENFVNLEELFLDDNDLDDTHTQFPKLLNLHTLMINKNRLQDVYKLADQLRYAYPNLAHLSLLGNEACPYRIMAISQSGSSDTSISTFTQSRLDEEYQRYRHFIVFRIPTLKFLDASEISSNERHIAEQLGHLLYSIAESKQSQQALTDDEKRNNRKEFYTPLPKDVDGFVKRTGVMKARHKYNGEGSQGNKFVRDMDL